jgi:hypothetical protein
MDGLGSPGIFRGVAIKGKDKVQPVKPLLAGEGTIPLPEEPGEQAAEPVENHNSG